MEVLEAGYRTSDIARGDIAGQTKVTTTEMGRLVLDRVEADWERLHHERNEKAICHAVARHHR